MPVMDLGYWSFVSLESIGSIERRETRTVVVLGT